ncbi:MAG: endonuclease MutS2 [Bacilli bacterium]|nr:endonuclease MutS2 [Bacilli bacterium]
MDKYAKLLEFDKILSQVAEEAVLSKSKDIILEGELSTELDILKYKLDIADEAVILKNRMGSIPIHFSDDVGLYLSKVNKAGVLSEHELACVSNFLDTIRDLFVYNEKLDNFKIESPLFSAVIKSITYPKDLNLRIKEIITPYGEIKDSASPALKDIRKKIKEADNAIKAKLQEFISKNGDKLSQSIVTVRNDRYVIPVKNDYKNSIKGIIHDQSSSGETVFIEPLSVFEASNKLNHLYEEEKDEIYNILRSVSFKIASYYDELSFSYEEIVKLDIVFAKAKYAIRLNCTKPNINSNGIVNLIGAKHPLLNVAKVVANNIIIGKDYKGIIITGPNTGGKTVLLKTIGLLSLMVKFGMLLPCEADSDIMIFDNVYADIGDEQSIEANLSTFSSHLKNVIDIMDNVTNNSLVVLDELGSGTDPLEGSSLAISIFDFLLKKNCLVIATSHYSELKMHAYNSSDIINASVEFDEVTLKPTYRLLIGVPGMSNAINIARNLGLNKDVIAKAEDYVFSRSDDLNVMLDKLVKQSKMMDEKIQELDNTKKELKQKLEDQTKKLEDIEESKEAIIAKANKEVKAMIEAKMEEVNDLIDELKTVKKVTLPELANLKHKANMLEEGYIASNDLPKKEEIKVGDNVYVKSYECYGKVIKDLGNDKYNVSIGNATMKLSKSDLRLTKVDSEIDVKTKPASTFIPRKQVSLKLDLRGMRYEEAKDKIDAYLDEAMYSGLHQVTIIHGFGTGTVRKLVQERLKENKNVASFRYGQDGEGGQGATIVEFKE